MNASHCPRTPALSSVAMVATNHTAVSSLGLATLQAGGNALDATVAMAALCWLTLPGQCGVGGDAFAIVREPDGRVWTAGGSGFGPDGGEPQFYRDLGLTSLPLTGPLAVAGAGAVGVLAALHAAGAARPLTELWAPAVARAGSGIPCSAKTRADILDHEAELRRDEGMARVFLRDGQAPQIGERLTYPDLARTIKRLSRDPDDLYSGDLAQRAVAFLNGGGAPFSGREWVASGVPLTGPAISHAYGPVTVHETPPPSPGWMVLQQAALCDGLLAGTPWLGAEAVDLLAGAARTSFRDRYERCGSDTDAWRAVLTPDAVRAARAGLRGGGSLATAGAAGAGDTTSTVVVDGDGRAVSFIQSLALTFGAHVTVPGTGVVLNNRLGRGAYLTDGHPNEVRPGRRPLHTLNAWLVTDAEGRLAHAGNSPGGDGQVQWNMQAISHLVDHGMDPEQAVSAPRFAVYPGSDANTIGAPAELICEDRLGEPVLAALAAAGHRIRRVGPWGGGGGALVLSADHRLGCLAGAADPRQDGVALGA